MITLYPCLAQSCHGVIVKHRRVLPTAAAPAQDLKSNEAKEEKVETEEKTVEKDSKSEEKATDKTENTNSEDK